MLEVMANICVNPNCACITSESRSYCGEGCRKQDDLDDAVDYCHCGHKHCLELSLDFNEDELFDLIAVT